MLTTLRIKNLALAADLTLELQPGFNVITGETGAGKSILLGALTLVLGERADRTLIRAGADGCAVEAVFNVAQLRAPLAAFLSEHGLEPCDENLLVLKRTFTAAGANRQFINGSPAPLKVLAEIGEWLVDIHGPHEHQSLLHAPRQLAILDAFGRLESERTRFAELLQLRARIEADKAALIVDEQTYARQLDLLRFQAQEIEAARLLPEEETRVQEQFDRARNRARLIELTQAALSLLADSEPSLQSQAGALGRILQELQRADGTASSFATQQAGVAEGLRELHAALAHYLDALDVDPARLAELESRWNLLQTLKRKYGASVAAVIEFGANARRQLEQLEQRDATLGQLNAQLRQVENDLLVAGKKLTAARRKLIPRLTKAASRELADLGFRQSHFDVALTSRGELDGQVSASGLDAVEFQFAPNPGEPARSLRAIASSGEMARVMLALKTVLAAEDEVPLLVFDEVDANVGGETAVAVGEKMRAIAKNRQVLCITHLAPIAATGDAHFVVNKETRDGRTISSIEPLEGKSRVTELARMLGGQSDAARRHAAELLKAAPRS